MSLQKLLRCISPALIGATIFLLPQKSGSETNVNDIVYAPGIELVQRHENINLLEAKVTDQFGGLVERHVQQMFDQGLAKDIAKEDLDHGHLLRKISDRGQYLDIECFLSQVELILYHTDEDCSRWKSSALPPYEKKQRSIIGKTDGTIETALDYINMVPEDLGCLNTEDVYLEYGTLFSWDILNKYNYLDDGELALKIINVPNKDFVPKECFPEYYFQIYKEKGGRFSVQGEQFEVYIILNSLNNSPQDSIGLYMEFEDQFPLLKSEK